MPRPLAPTLLLGLALAAGPACASGGEDGGEAPEPAVLVGRAPDAAALAPMPGGGLRYGERLTGVVREVGPRGARRGREVARVAVSAEGQRGLLGLAVDRRGRTFAAWTTRSQRLVVAQVDPGGQRLVWNGPRTVRLGNGGHLALSPNGRLVIGVGDRNVREAGVLLELDPDAAAAAQEARVLSRGWNNPFAFDFLGPFGGLWVADNAPGRGPERVARGDAGPRPADVTDIEGKVAPSGLAPVVARPQEPADDPALTVPTTRRMAICGVVSRRLDPWEVDDEGRARPAGEPLARDCSLGVSRLADGRLVYSTGRELKVVAP